MFMGAAIGVGVGFWSNASEFFDGPVPWVATALSCVMCLGVFHYVEYADGFVNLVREAHEIEDPALGVIELDDAQAQELADRTLQRAVGQGGFVGFLKLRARAGLRLRGFGPGMLGSGFALGIWILDILVLLLLAFRVAVGAARRGGS
jgi:hypothetical protein